MEHPSLILALAVVCLCCSGAAAEQFRPASVSEGEELFDHEVFDQEMLVGGAEQRMKLKDLPREQAAQEIKILMGRVDENKDGKLDEQEIVAWLEKVEDRNYISEANAVFDKEDTNGDGFVTFEEYWMNTEEEELPVSDEHFNDAQVGVGIRFKDADSDQDGRLDREEFLPFIHPFRHDHMVGHLVEDQLVLYDGDRDGFISMAEYLLSFNPDRLPEDELPMVGDERSEFKDHLDKDHDGVLGYEEIKEWLVPDDVEFFQEEARHLISHADKDKDGMLSLEEVDEEFDIFADSPITDYGHVMHKEL